MNRLQRVPLGGWVVFGSLALTTAVFHQFAAPFRWPDTSWLFWLRTSAPYQASLFIVVSGWFSVSLFGLLSRSWAGRLSGALLLAALVAVTVVHAPFLFEGQPLAPAVSRHFFDLVFPP